MSHEEFCSKRGLKVSSFRVWLYRVRKARRAIREVALVPVEVTKSPRAGVVVPSQAPPGLVLTVADIEVRVAVGTDVGYVSSLVLELRSRC